MELEYNHAVNATEVGEGETSRKILKLSVT